MCKEEIAKSNNNAKWVSALRGSLHVPDRLGGPPSLGCLKNKIQFGALPLLCKSAHYLFRDNIALINLKLL